MISVQQTINIKIRIRKG